MLGPWQGQLSAGTRSAAPAGPTQNATPPRVPTLPCTSPADGVVSTSDSVHGKLQQRQEEVEELGAVRVLLHKLQAVFELPRKLRAAMDREAYDVAADCYADAAPLLRKYGHKASEQASLVG